MYQWNKNIFPSACLKVLFVYLFIEKRVSYSPESHMLHILGYQRITWNLCFSLTSYAGLCAAQLVYARLEIKPRALCLHSINWATALAPNTWISKTILSYVVCPSVCVNTGARATWHTWVSVVTFRVVCVSLSLYLHPLGWKLLRILPPLLLLPLQSTRATVTTLGFPRILGFEPRSSDLQSK